MNFTQIAQDRQSCRAYIDKKVDHDTLIEMVRSTANAPSACNSQPWHFVIVNDQEMLKDMTTYMQESGINKFTDNVSSYIVICETKAVLMKGATCDSQYYAQMDIGIATAHLALHAQSQGLATCIMGAFNKEMLTELLNVPKEANIRLVLAVGYAQNDTVRNKVRKDFDSICGVNKW